MIAGIFSNASEKSYENKARKMPLLKIFNNGIFPKLTKKRNYAAATSASTFG